MKLSEMNPHQRAATVLVREVMSEEIAGPEICFDDYRSGDPEYDEAKKFLTQGKEVLASTIYNSVMCLSQSNKDHATPIRFAGKDFIMARINARLSSWGYDDPNIWQNK